MAVFSAYFDASGVKQMRVLTVAGFVTTVRKWDRFDGEWSALLAGEALSAMHMTDFASSQGEFASWKGQTERRREFMDRLCACIKRNTNKGFASSLVLSDYGVLNAEFRLMETVGQPFTLCMRSCLGGLKLWAKRKKVTTDRLLVYIEHGDQDQGELIKRARDDGFKIIPLFKADAQAFQAGDLAAWKSRVAIEDVTYGPLESEADFKKIVRSLDPIKHIVQNNGAYDAEALRKLCLGGQVPRRTG
jgi:hypothetical protein